MPYTPTFTVLHTRAIADNLLAYVATNQADALTWAGGGSLRTIKQFSNSVANRAVPVFPSIAFVDDTDAQSFDNDLVNAAYSVTFEVLTQHANPNTAVSEARTYAKMLLSIFRNCPVATWIADSGADQGYIDSAEVGFAEIKTNDAQNEFMQEFQIRLTFQLTGSAYVPPPTP